MNNQKLPTLDVKNGKSVAAFCRSFDARHLGLILFPTEQCNFRCTYCYEDFKLRKMSSDVRDAVKKLITKRLPELRTMEISWFGGEPLLAVDIIDEINSHVIDTGQGVDLASNITTNGYLLTPEVLDRLLALKVSKYQISFDGFGQVHDKTRKRANSLGTFDRIWENLLKSKSHASDFEVILRLHFHPENVDSCKEFIEQFIANFEGDTRYKIYAKNVSHLGSENDSNFDVFTWKQSKEIQSELEALLPENQIWGGAGAYDELYVCYAAQPNNIAIRSDGSLAKCTVDLHSERNRIGRINHDGGLDVDKTKFKFWIRGLETMDRKNLSCPMQD